MRKYVKELKRKLEHNSFKIHLNLVKIALLSIWILHSILFNKFKKPKN